jgi:hypothetical protein
LKDYATGWRVTGSILGEVIGFFFLNPPNPSSSTMALRWTQSLAESITRNLLKGKKREVLKANNLIAIFEPTVCNTTATC